MMAVTIISIIIMGASHHSFFFHKKRSKFLVSESILIRKHFSKNALKISDLLY